MTLSVRLYIALVISCDLALQRRFYFKSEDQPSETGSFKNGKSRRVVVDLESMLEIDDVIVEMHDVAAEKPSVYISHFDGVKEQKHDCIFKGGSSFACKTGGRIVVVESKDFMQEVKPRTAPMAYDTYIGCFGLQKTFVGKIKKKILPDFCITSCGGTSFFAVNYTHHCFCVTSLGELQQVDLNLCNEIFGGFQVIGGGNFLATYWKDRNTTDYVKPSWNCIYDLTNCPMCPEGRKGIFCEIIDCSVNNGGCGDSKCQSYSPWKLVNFTNCLCTSGFRIVTEQCEDIDECTNSSNQCHESTTKCRNNIGSYTCECASGFKRLNAFECEALQEHEKDQEKEQDKEQKKEKDKEQEKENETEQKDPTAEMNLVHTGVGSVKLLKECVHDSCGFFSYLVARTTFISNVT